MEIMTFCQEQLSMEYFHNRKTTYGLRRGVNREY